MHYANWPRVPVFWKGILDNGSSRMVRDPGGRFASNELREWPSFRGIGLLAAPGEFHGLENLIRVIKSLARKLDEDHPELTRGSFASLALSSHIKVYKTVRYSPVQWAFGADNEGHGFTTMPSEIETFRMAATSRHCKSRREMPSQSCSTQQSQRNNDLSPRTWVMYFRRGTVTIQIKSLFSTSVCLFDRVSSTMERIGALFNGPNWCRLGFTWKQTDQVTPYSASSV